MKYLLALIAAFALAHPAQAQTNNRIGIYVYCTNETNDWVGQRVCTALRDKISASPRYSLLTSEPKTFHYVAHIVTMSIQNNVDTAYSFVLNVEDEKSALYLTHSVGYCGSGRVEESAGSTFAMMDATISKQ